MFTEKSFSTFTIYINYSHWHQCLYCVLFLWEETRAPEESNMPYDLCVYPMIGLKRCRNQDIWPRIQIPVSSSKKALRI